MSGSLLRGRMIEVGFSSLCAGRARAPALRVRRARVGSCMLILIKTARVLFERLQVTIVEIEDGRYRPAIL